MQQFSLFLYRVFSLHFASLEGRPPCKVRDKLFANGEGMW